MTEKSLIFIVLIFFIVLGIVGFIKMNKVKLENPYAIKRGKQEDADLEELGKGHYKYERDKEDPYKKYVDYRGWIALGIIALIALYFAIVNN